MADAGLSSDRGGIFEPTGNSKAGRCQPHSHFNRSKVNLLGRQIRFTNGKSVFWGLSRSCKCEENKIYDGKIWALGN